METPPSGLPPDSRASAPRPVVQPLPYHRDLVGYLRRPPVDGCPPAGGPGSTPSGSSPSLRPAYWRQRWRKLNPLSRDGREDLYSLAEEVAADVGLTVPVELYRSSDLQGHAAAFQYHPGMARVVVRSPLEDRLEGNELRAFFGRVFACHRFWWLDEGCYAQAWLSLLDLRGISLQFRRRVDSALRLYALSTVVLADRVALAVAGFDATLASLVKHLPGLNESAGYDLGNRGGARIWAQGACACGIPHLDVRIRILCLYLFARDRAASEERIRRLIEGCIHLSEREVFRQRHVDDLRERLAETLHQSVWFLSGSKVGRESLMFDDLEPSNDADVAALDCTLPPWRDAVRFSPALRPTDFFGVDPALEDLPFLGVHELVEDYALTTQVERAVNLELRGHLS